ncbi:hypothetical protein ACLB2K_051285 [Fragaria x ananassa]
MTTLTKLCLITILFFLPCFLRDVVGVQVLSKSKLEKCKKTSDYGDLNCTKKIVLNIAVPSGADVAYKPEEYHVETRKCEPDADAKVKGNYKYDILFFCYIEI